MVYTKLHNLMIRSQPCGAFSHDAIDLVASVRKDWGAREGLVTKMFNDGISNAIIGVYKVSAKIRLLSYFICTTHLQDDTWSGTLVWCIYILGVPPTYLGAGFYSSGPPAKVSP